MIRGHLKSLICGHFIPRLTVPKIQHQGRNFANVEAVYFMKNRPQTIVPYEDGIQDYNNLSIGSQRRSSEMALMQFFSPHEAKLVRAATRKELSQPAVIVEVPLPIPSDTIVLANMREESIIGHYDPELNLPFDVGAMFVVDKARKPSDRWQDEYALSVKDSPVWFLPRAMVLTLRSRVNFTHANEGF